MSYGLNPNAPRFTAGVYPMVPPNSPIGTSPSSSLKARSLTLPHSPMKQIFPANIPTSSSAGIELSKFKAEPLTRVHLPVELESQALGQAEKVRALKSSKENLPTSGSFTPRLSSEKRESLTIPHDELAWQPSEFVINTEMPGELLSVWDLELSKKTETVAKLCLFDWSLTEEGSQLAEPFEDFPAIDDVPLNEKRRRTDRSLRPAKKHCINETWIKHPSSIVVGIDPKKIMGSP